MKAYIELIIDGVQVGLPTGDFPFLISYRIANEIGEVAGSSADRFISVPASKAVNNLYKTYSEVGSSNKDAIKYKDSSITTNGLPLFSGRSQLQRAVLTGKGRPYKRVADSYKVAFFGQNADWLISLKDVKLSDLLFADVLFNSVNVLAGLNNSYSGGDFYGFHLGKWKTWNNETGGTTAKGSVAVGVDEFTPFLFIRSILERIFDNIGYSIASDFVDTERFKSLIFSIPPIKKYPQEYSDDYLNFKARVPNLTITPVNPIVGTPLIGSIGIQVPPLNLAAWDVVTATYTVLQDCYCIMNSTMEATAISGTAPQGCLWGLAHNDPDLLNNGFILGALGSFVPVGPPGPPVFVGEQSVYETQVFLLQAGDTLQLQAVATRQGGSPGTVDIYGTIELQFEALFGLGNLIVWKYLLKDYTALDFLNGLTDIYNFRFENNKTKQIVRIEPRSDYPDTSQGSGLVHKQGFFLDDKNLDYTPKLDYSKDSTLERINADELQAFQWETDGETEKVIEEGESKGIYNATYKLQPNTFNPKEKEKKVRFFAKTIHIRESIIQSDPDVVGVDIAPLIPLFFPQNYQLDNQADTENFDIKPRILHFFGQRGGLDGYIQISGVGNVECPACFFTNYNDQTGLDPSLSFATETINGLPVAGVLESFYLHQMAAISNSKRLKEWVVWSSLMINNLSFRDTIKLDGIRYILEEITNFDPTAEKSVKTTLLPHVLADVTDLDNIENTLLTGVALLYP